ncbi:hypothetical protein EJB05_39043, partial [Eragrostis curvula]
MSSGASNPSAATVNNPPLKRNSDDVRWEYGTLIDPNDLNVIQCKLCPKVVKAGIYRLKLHIAGKKGQVTACPNATEEDKEKCKKALEDSSKNKKARKEHQQDVRDDVTIEIPSDGEEDTGLEAMGGSEARAVGPMDKFTSPMDSSSLSNSIKKTHQTRISEHLMKERLHKLKRYIARNRLTCERLEQLVFVRFNNLNAKKKEKAKKNKLVDPLLSTEATCAQGWIVEGGEADDGTDVEPVTGLTWKLIAETCGAEEVTKLRRSAWLNQAREIEDDVEMESEEEPMDEEDFDFESDQEDVVV